MPDKKCKFCGAQADLVKSHIIPEGLYWGLHDDETPPPLLASPHEGEFQARRPNGIWDRFLCAAHEQQFNDWDTHAVEVLREPDAVAIDGGWAYEKFQYEKLKLFFVSLLWRAHSTDADFFDRVKLGIHAARLKRLIEARSTGRQSDYAVMLWRSDELIAKAVIAPFCERYAGVRFVRFYLPGYMALIKVDQQPLPQEFRGQDLSAAGAWFVPRRDYKGRGEERAMLHTAKRNLEKKNAKRS